MQLDARDLFSPKPTVMALEALAGLRDGEALAVMVNAGKPVDELMHLAEEHHCGFLFEDEGDYVVCTFTPTQRIKIERPPLEEALRLMGITPLEAPTVLFGSDKLGQGNDLVGEILANEFIIDLTLQEDLPSAVVFYNSGAKLTQEGSPAIEYLQILEELGVEILTDAVSVEAFGSEDKVAVGDVVDPYIICALLTSQPGVITL
jgi:TusA-related sulfurtransferase